MTCLAFDFKSTFEDFEMQAASQDEERKLVKLEVVIMDG